MTSVITVVSLTLLRVSRSRIAVSRGVSVPRCVNIEDAIEDRGVASSVSLSRTQSRIAVVVNNYMRPKFCPLRRSIADE